MKMCERDVVWVRRQPVWKWIEWQGEVALTQSEEINLGHYSYNTFFSFLSNDTRGATEMITRLGIHWYLGLAGITYLACIMAWVACVSWVWVVLYTPVGVMRWLRPSSSWPSRGCLLMSSGDTYTGRLPLTMTMLKITHYCIVTILHNSDHKNITALH